MTLYFDSRTHTYTYEGRVVPSVTQILEPLCGMQFVDPDVLARAQDFGTAVHRACELWDHGVLKLDTLDPALVPYLDAWLKFNREHDVSWELIEGRVHNKPMGYAGTVDRYGHVNGHDAVVDIKTGAALYPTVGPQLAAYSRAIPQATVSTRRLGVLLKEDGNYEMKEYTSPLDWPVFASLLTLRSFCQTHSITPCFEGKKNGR